MFHHRSTDGYVVFAEWHGPLMLEEAAGPPAARGMAIFAVSALGFLAGWSLGIMTWSATWRRAKALSASSDRSHP